jgi:hypothetical protein
MLYNGSWGIVRVPEMMGGLEGMMVTSRLRYMCTERELKIAVHELSQIWPTERSEPEASLGKAWDLVVVEVRCGMGSCAVAVEVIMLPFGTMTWTAGFVVEIFLWRNCGVIW